LFLRVGAGGQVVLPAGDGGDLVEEALDGVEFGGAEWAHRTDHAGEQGAEEVLAECDGMLADPDLDLAPVRGAGLPVDVPGGLQPVDQGGGGGEVRPS
jgi:hypothetical protein